MSRSAVRVKSGFGPCLCSRQFFSSSPLFPSRSSSFKFLFYKFPTFPPSFVQHLDLNCRTMASKRKVPVAQEEGRKKSRAITSFFSGTGGGSGGGGTATTPVINFDKDAWAKTLTESQRRLLRLELETMHVSWLAELKDVLITPQFLSLKEFLEREKKDKRTVYPAEADIYSWSRHCPLYKVKVVILGQDPYHGENQAHGLSFSVRPPTPAPPSLLNMYICLKNDYPNFKPPPNKGGLLVPWAEQGVLMLNASLTVRKGEPNSHANKGWELLTGKAIEVVAKKRAQGVVFMAWGRFAQGRCKGLDRKKHKILESVHPSPLSASRGFLKCEHFKKANEFLEYSYGVDGIIDWNLGGAPAAGPAIKKVIKTVPKVDAVISSAAEVPDVEVMKITETSTNEDKNSEKEEEESMEVAAEASTNGDKNSEKKEQPMEVAKANTNGDENNEKEEESRERAHDDTDYDSDGLE